MTKPIDNSDDAVLDDYLTGDSTLSNTYRQTADALPSSALDAAILAAAREQPATSAHKKPALLSLWEKPVSIAAAMLLCASLVVYMQSSDDIAPFGQSGVGEPSVRDGNLDAASETGLPVIAQSRDASANVAAPDAATESRAALNEVLQSTTGDAKKAERREQAADATAAHATPNQQPGRTASVAPVFSAPLQESVGRSTQEALTADQASRRAASNGLITGAPLDGLIADVAESEDDAVAGRGEGLGSASETSQSPPPVRRDAGEISDDEQIDQIVVTGTRLPAATRPDPNARRTAKFSGAADDRLTAAQFEDLAKDQPERALQRIAALWEAGEQAMATERLRSFRSFHPDYSQRRLKAELPEAMLRFE